jgi:hypothetical protein
MVDCIVPAARIQGAGVGEEGFCFEGEQFVNQAFETGGFQIGVVSIFSDVDFDGGKIVFLKTARELCGPEKPAGFFRDNIVTILQGGFYEIYGRTH